MAKQKVTCSEASTESWNVDIWKVGLSEAISHMSKEFRQVLKQLDNSGKTQIDLMKSLVARTQGEMGDLLRKGTGERIRQTDYHLVHTEKIHPSRSFCL